MEKERLLFIIRINYRKEFTIIDCKVKKARTPSQSCKLGLKFNN